jgi:hypothetical protein
MRASASHLPGWESRPAGHKTNGAWTSDKPRDEVTGSWSKANEGAFLAAVEETDGASARLIHVLETNAPQIGRDEPAERAKARAAERFGA